MYPAKALAMLIVAFPLLDLAEADTLVAPGIAMHGDTKYRPGFSHFDYVNAEAPKGGDFRKAALGTFDNLNPFIPKGVTPRDLRLIFDTLMVPSEDEPFSVYGLIAETIEVPHDRSWVVFNLRRDARFHDDSPIIADDVIWSFDILKREGLPYYRVYYGSVAKVEKLDQHVVKFTFAPGGNRELPLILSDFPILSRKHYQIRDFSKTTLEGPLGSGPYKVGRVDPGRSITFDRVHNYWGRDLPVNKGRFNFDRVRVDYYRDQTSLFEAFKVGDYDLRVEDSPKLWALGYDWPAAKDGRVIREEIPNEQPQGMLAYAYNIRREAFRDARVREALAYAFDFEWSNKALFYNTYRRIPSFFSNSELASQGVPSLEELMIIDPLKSSIPGNVLSHEYRPPKTDGSGDIRENLAIAHNLLRSAGWIFQNGKAIDAKTGRLLRFEILLIDPAFERVTLMFVRNLARLGVEAHIRYVDTAQYMHRLNSFDFDMIVHWFRQSLSPGNEQRAYWGSESADMPGSRNVIGIKEDAVDQLVELLISAPDRPNLLVRARALDRVLLWNHYVIPLWSDSRFRLAYWDRFGRPLITAKYTRHFGDTWWIR